MNLPLNKLTILTIDPTRGFGQPCIPGTRIPAESVAERIFAGDSVEEVVEDYDITYEQALLCCWWEIASAQEIAPSKRNQYQRVIVKDWGDWADKYLTYAGGHKEGPIPSPQVP